MKDRILLAIANLDQKSDALASEMTECYLADRDTTTVRRDFENARAELILSGEIQGKNQAERDAKEHQLLEKHRTKLETHEDIREEARLALEVAELRYRTARYEVNALIAIQKSGSK